MHSIVQSAITILMWLGAMMAAVGVVSMIRQVYGTMISTPTTGHIVSWTRNGHGKAARYRAQVNYSDHAGAEHTVRLTIGQSQTFVDAHPVGQPCSIRYVTQFPGQAELEETPAVRYGYFALMVAIGVGCVIVSNWIYRVTQ